MRERVPSEPESRVEKARARLVLVPVAGLWRERTMRPTRASFIAREGMAVMVASSKSWPSRASVEREPERSENQAESLEVVMSGPLRVAQKETRPSGARMGSERAAKEAPGMGEGAPEMATVRRETAWAWAREEQMRKGRTGTRR
jgi:hypothetical protein